MCCAFGSPTDSVLLGAIIRVVVLLLVVTAVIAGIVVVRNKKKNGQRKCVGDERCGDSLRLGTRSECCREVVAQVVLVHLTYFHVKMVIVDSIIGIKVYLMDIESISHKIQQILCKKVCVLSMTKKEISKTS